MTLTPHRKHALLLTVAGLLVIALSGCAAQPERLSGATEFGHVHGLDIDPSSGTVYAATHNGVWELPPIDSGTIEEEDLDGPIADRAQDTMGFTMVDSQMLASGHPDPLEQPDLVPPNLGLIQSYDGADTWEPVSRRGETDFHDLSAVQQATGALHIYGYEAGTGTVSFSDDSGRTWTAGATIAARDLTANPTEPGTLYATTEAGLMGSADNGATFSLMSDAPVLYLVDADKSGQLVGIDVDGGVWNRPADGAWQQTGTAEGEVDAFTFSSDLKILIAYDSRGVVASGDLGNTWQILVSKS